MATSQCGIKNKKVGIAAWRLEMRVKEARIVAVENLQWVYEVAGRSYMRRVIDMHTLANAA
eukprot:4822628-Karenia_brevis.AAC.1